jgi:hypothetical protein
VDAASAQWLGVSTCWLVLSVKEVDNVPFEYVDFLPSVQTALKQFVANMNRFGMPIEAILTAGSMCCRCITNTDQLSNHSRGDAFDLVGVRWANSGGRETIMHNWNTAEREVLRRINACLRLSFATSRIASARSDTAHPAASGMTQEMPTPRARPVGPFVGEPAGSTQYERTIVRSQVFSTARQPLRRGAITTLHEKSRFADLSDHPRHLATS